ncbi:MULTISPECIES: DUF456 domain-containing protein [Pseudonocardia]|uniref:DUF456 domain-containing protein n=2 Tax=Pseudonocardia TaxID=1847 RepID=A0A1Y2N1E6_PSEAH|nr:MULTISPECIES: DUF456 domain-containing protein [Pseudonocardia]OSY41304.1 hypothetical protein BG845_02206 [Pseudonocardia autotrophica]TDN76760.1 hypothetical protein C8E95_5978 [Pseudonocardia autotrophica]BBG00761.1 membrane protein [Pseudonocardia autotrophica]GEC24273.1 membrane protein [Pseudonocardia saturnea]
MTGLAVLAGLMIAVGLAGIVLPVLPGPLLIIGGVAVWAVPRGDAVGWWVLGIAVAVTIVGQVAKYLLPGRRLKASGVPTRTLLAGLLLGVIGFFVIPVIGLFIGFVLGVWLAELVRLPDATTAWRSAREALTAVGWSILIELAAGMLATAVWIGGLVAG